MNPFFRQVLADLACQTDLDLPLCPKLRMALACAKMCQWDLTNRGRGPKSALAMGRMAVKFLRESLMAAEMAAMAADEGTFVADEGDCVVQIQDPFLPGTCVDLERDTVTQEA